MNKEGTKAKCKRNTAPMYCTIYQNIRKYQIILCWEQNGRQSTWRWRQHVPLKHWYPTTSLHGVITQKTVTVNLHLHGNLKSQKL